MSTKLLQKGKSYFLSSSLMRAHKAPHHRIVRSVSTAINLPDCQKQIILIIILFIYVTTFQREKPSFLNKIWYSPRNSLLSNPPFPHVLMLYISAAMGISCPSHFCVPPLTSLLVSISCLDTVCGRAGIFHSRGLASYFCWMRSQQILAGGRREPKNMFSLVLNRDVICPEIAHLAAQEIYV